MHFHCLERVYHTLNRYGKLFSKSFWKTIFTKVLQPLIENINKLFLQKRTRKQKKSKKKNHLKAICVQAFLNMITVFEKFFDKLHG